MSLKKTGERACFIASNSAKGFFSYYHERFGNEKIDRVFILKGGPGTGKSRFMRTVAEFAAAEGWGIEYIYCSSDADSLDAIILSSAEMTVAVLDGTAPHVFEANLPGVREEIVNLGEFWRSEALLGQREEIIKRNEEKKKAYQMAYRYLAGLGAVMQNRDDLVFPFMKIEEIGQYAERILEDVRMGQAFSEEPALHSSVGMGGEVTLDTYFSQAKKLFLVEDCRGCVQYFMRVVYRICREKRLRIRVSFDPVLPDRIDGIFLLESGWAFVSARAEGLEYPHRRLSLRRFVKTSEMKPIRPMLNHLDQMSRALRGGVLEAMGAVRNAHFALEAIYSASMDFARKEAFTKCFCEEHFLLQKKEECDTIEKRL